MFKYLYEIFNSSGVSFVSMVYNICWPQTMKCDFPSQLERLPVSFPDAGKAERIRTGFLQAPITAT